MKFIRIILTVAIPLLMMTAVMAQEKQYQAGFRMGVTSGFTGRTITNDMWAFEGIVGFRSGGAQIYGLLESRKRLEFPRTDKFFLYYGGGAHLGFVGWHKYYAYEYYDRYNHWSRYENYGFAFGFDGIVGLEYQFESVPITLGADFKPFFEFYGPFYFRANFWDFAFGIRYTF